MVVVCMPTLYFCFEKASRPNATVKYLTLQSAGRNALKFVHIQASIPNSIATVRGSGLRVCHQETYCCYPKPLLSLLRNLVLITDITLAHIKREEFGYKLGSILITPTSEPPLFQRFTKIKRCHLFPILLCLHLV